MNFEEIKCNMLNITKEKTKHVWANEEAPYIKYSISESFDYSDLKGFWINMCISISKAIDSNSMIGVINEIREQYKGMIKEIKASTPFGGNTSIKIKMELEKGNKNEISLTYTSSSQN